MRMYNMYNAYVRHPQKSIHPVRSIGKEPIPQGCCVTPILPQHFPSPWVINKNFRIQKYPKIKVLYHIRSYKAIFCGDIPLHRPYIGFMYIW